MMDLNPMKLLIKYQVLAAVLTGGLATTAVAIDQAAKEETTPPPALGALTVEQIPPINITSPPPKQPQPKQPVAPPAAQSTESNNIPLSPIY
jgi:hypothetical protein